MQVTGVKHWAFRLVGMSFQDDLLEPEAIDSAAHFLELVRVVSDDTDVERGTETRAERHYERRALPRELGN